MGGRTGEANTQSYLCFCVSCLLCTLLIFLLTIPHHRLYTLFEAWNLLNLESSPTVLLCSSLFVYIWYYMMGKKKLKAHKIDHQISDDLGGVFSHGVLGQTSDSSGTWNGG